MTDVLASPTAPHRGTPFAVAILLSDVTTFLIAGEVWTGQRQTNGPSL